MTLRPIQSRRPKLDRIEPDKREAVINAISEYDISSSPAWSVLDELSSRTVVEALEPSPDGIFKTGSNAFEAVANVYLTLNYGGKQDSVSSPETFPVYIQGHFKDDLNVEIDNVEIDTSSFYE